MIYTVDDIKVGMQIWFHTDDLKHHRVITAMVSDIRKVDNTNPIPSYRNASLIALVQLEDWKPEHKDRQFMENWFYFYGLDIEDVEGP